jgi:hypothetical protein
MRLTTPESPIVPRPVKVWASTTPEEKSRTAKAVIIFLMARSFPIIISFTYISDPNKTTDMLSGCSASKTSGNLYNEIAQNFSGVLPTRFCTIFSSSNGV